MPCLMLDVDGVLVSGGGAHWTDRIHADLGIFPGTLRAKFFDRHWRRIIVGEAALRDVLAEVLPRIAPHVSVARFIDYWFTHEAQIYPAVLTAVDHLRQTGTRVFLATNQEHERAAYLMDTLRLADHVDGIIYSAKVGARKPDPGFYRAAERIAGCAPGDLILIDDTRANVAAARQRGWRAHFWTGNADLVDLVGS